ncbi:hypothetical protein C8Q77DRAFT_701010 [Trametes polyzona]|nr:hypothetical protein C8Q77DRAFT_701010 [Trametes polyzona]
MPYNRAAVELYCRILGYVRLDRPRKWAIFSPSGRSYSVREFADRKAYRAASRLVLGCAARSHPDRPCAVTMSFAGVHLGRVFSERLGHLENTTTSCYDCGYRPHSAPRHEAPLHVNRAQASRGVRAARRQCCTWAVVLRTVRSRQDVRLSFISRAVFGRCTNFLKPHERIRAFSKRSYPPFEQPSVTRVMRHPDTFSLNSARVLTCDCFPESQSNAARKNECDDLRRRSKQ